MATSTTSQDPTPTVSAPEPTPAPSATAEISIANPFSLRPPTSSLPIPNSSKRPTSFTPPSHTWMSGKWYVTHSTLPLWKDKRNVTITYEILSDKKVRDTTAYQTSHKGKVKTLSGVNTPPVDNPGAFDWRGQGWLKIASSHWEVLGWGDADGSLVGKEKGTDGGEEEGHRWIVTYFSKTLFTPAGIDIYSRKKGGLPAEAVEGVKKALAGLEAEEVKRLVGEIFEVLFDGDE